MYNWCIYQRVGVFLLKLLGNKYSRRKFMLLKIVTIVAQSVLTFIKQDRVKTINIRPF